MADVNEFIKGLEIQLDDLRKFADEDQPLTLTQEQAKEILVMLKEQNERIEKMRTLLGEADEEIRELKAQNRPGFGG